MTTTRTWSPQQTSIFDWFRTPNPKRPNLVVRARAGTGKTTTIIEAITHAPEARILLAAFNKRIQTELSERLTNPNAEALTLHSIGYRAVRRYWEKIGIDNRGQRATNLAERVCGASAPDAIKRLVAKLNSKAREIAPLAITREELEPLAVQFDCVPDDGWEADGFTTTYVCEKALEALRIAAAEKPISTGIDFADMIFLPLRNRWLRPIYDLVVVDEAQDMTTTQLLLAQGVSAGRIVVVGDDRQAIYGFRGADSEALDRLKRELDADELTLNTTYRCGRAIVAEAQQIVADFEAGPNNPEGIIRAIGQVELATQVGPGDFVLSRKNAPLVSIALGLIRRGVRVKIEGRDIGAGLKALVNKLAKGPARNSIPRWLERLDAWRERELQRASSLKLESKVDEINDRFETLLALADGVSGIAELLARLDNLFADTQGAPAYVVCSSVHKAKGLEAERVFILRGTLYPPVACDVCKRRHGANTRADHGYVPDPLAEREEQNIAYVAVTRAKAELVWVD